MDSERLNWSRKVIPASVLVLFSLFFFLDYISLALGLVPRELTWFPEVISIGFLFYILVRLAKGNDLIPILKQTHLVLLFLVFTLFGILINRVDLAVAAAGVRNNLKYMPLFFLPFFYKFDQNFLKKLLSLMFIAALIQFPVVIIQRIVFQTSSGDPIGGTLGANSSGILSVFLCIALVFWSFFFIKNNIRSLLYILLSAMLIIPMGLNETKVVFFLLPIAFVCVFLFTKNKKKHLKKITVVFLCFCLGMLLIGSLYNILYVEEDLGPNGEKLKPSRKKIGEYYNPQRFMQVISGNKVRISGSLNRLPQVIFAFDQIKKDPVHLLFGVGAGNASDSFFEPAKGKYYQKYGELNIGNNLLSRMLWEYGLAGSLLFFSIYALFFVKGWRIRTSESLFGVAVSGFLVLIVIYLITSIYFNTMLMNLFGFLFWFLGGFLLAGDDSN
ncbi:MAG: hypothetical protein GF421_08115 [Candidatus Aminicenantes bacterium]|nr:hypothetical protein [Candidatus Aminicenantes bacterium]